MTSYFKQASMSGLILQFAFSYTDDNRPKLNNFKEMMELADYLDKQNMVDKFATYADKHGLQRRNLLIRKSHKLLERYINSRVIYNMLNDQAWNQYINQDDPVINKRWRCFKRTRPSPRSPFLPPSQFTKEAEGSYGKCALQLPFVAQKPIPLGIRRQKMNKKELRNIIRERKRQFSGQQLEELSLLV